MNENKKFNLALLLMFVLVLTLGAYLFLSNKESSESETVDMSQEIPMSELGSVYDPVIDEVDSENEYQGRVLAGGDSPFIEFNKEDYDHALASDKIIFLYFYAKWCPSCKAENRDATIPAFDEYSGENIIGFRVNYNDRDTDDFEESLAENFGVLYQHTKVVIQGENIEIYPNTWPKEEYINKFISL
ncbi:thioredoxin family protein [Candidatus Parcubacteria bacterium]|nr:thioredoxin family protein [Candidatus Parcubacteria bacterium]